MFPAAPCENLQTSFFHSGLTFRVRITHNCRSAAARCDLVSGLLHGLQGGREGGEGRWQRQNLHMPSLCLLMGVSLVNWPNQLEKKKFFFNMKFLCYGKIFHSSHFGFNWIDTAEEHPKEVESNFHSPTEMERLEREGDIASWTHGCTAAKAAVRSHIYTSSAVVYCSFNIVCLFPRCSLPVLPFQSSCCFKS